MSGQQHRPEKPEIPPPPPRQPDEALKGYIERSNKRTGRDADASNENTEDR